MCLTRLNISSARSLHSAEHLNPELTLLAPEPRPMPIPNSLPRSYPASIAAIDADMYISTENHTLANLLPEKDDLRLSGFLHAVTPISIRISLQKCEPHAFPEYFDAGLTGGIVHTGLGCLSQ